MDDHVLRFRAEIGKKKPDSFFKPSTFCPFCSLGPDENILEQRGTVTWVTNKFQTLENTWQTVIIETDACGRNLSNYTLEEWTNIFCFAVDHWLHLERSNAFKSVILFKNHGPNSGASIKHAHMQIVGLDEIEYMRNVEHHHVEGLVVTESHGIQMNISSHPFMGLFEFNLVGRYNTLSAPHFAQQTRLIARYILNSFNGGTDSFNIFFYRFGDDDIALKIVPRFVISPYYAGYQISLVATTLENIREHMLMSFPLYSDSDLYSV